jgi:acyl-CoA synthetase (AMP-forming)/AMP-acid ligase II
VPLAPTTPYEPIPAEALDQSLAARFADVVRRHGDRPVLRTRASTVTYAALDAMSARVAGALLDARGSGAEPVAVLAPKGVTQLAAFVGVLRAGKIATVLDGATPPERLRAILANAGIVTVLADAEQGKMASAVLPAGGVMLDAEAVAERGGAPAPAVAIAPDAPAYILHAS